MIKLSKNTTAVDEMAFIFYQSSKVDEKMKKMVIDPNIKNKSVTVENRFQLIY